MKRSILLNTCSFAGALLLAATAPAWAADDKAKAPGTAASSASAAGSTSAARIESDKLLGQSVKNRAGDTIGDIDSVLLDKDGKAVAAVIGVGGFLGMGERNVAVKWDALQIANNGREVRANFTKEQLEAMPEYKYSTDDRRRSAFYDENYRVSDASPAMNNAPRADMRSDARPDTRAGSTAASSASNWDALGPAGEIRASKLTGTDVVNAAGDKIGDIDEVVIGSNGQPKLILSIGGFLGMGEHRVAMDWNQVKLSREKDGDDLRAQVDLSKDQLQALPEYDFDATTRR